MTKKTILCSTTSEREILESAKAYLTSNGFEIQDVITADGKIGIQGRKTSWIRKCSGTSYALQIVVEKQSDSCYSVTAGWGEWVSKGAVVIISTFIAFGVLLIPAIFGIVNQKNLPDNCLDYVSEVIMRQNPICQIYNEAKQ